MASKVSIIKKSIVNLDTEIIVNAANSSLQHGSGVCGYIFEAAGPLELQEACNKIGGCPTGSAVITPGFNLCKYIVHAVGPKYRDGRHKEPQQLYSCYQKALDLAKENDCHSIGFPLISSGIYGYPKDQAWRQALQAVNDWVSANPGYEIDIQFAVLDDNTLALGEEVYQEVQQGQKEDKRNVFGDFVNNALKRADESRKAIKEFGDNAGKQVAKVAKDTREAIKQGADNLGEQLHQAKLDLDKKMINPLFVEDFYSDEFQSPNVIRIFDHDKKMDKEVSQGAIGFIEKIGDLKVVNLQKKELYQLTSQSINGQSFIFYPGIVESLYYVHPFTAKEYISLDEYFDYMKQARLDELERIAYDLGAKHFDIQYVEEKKSFASVKGKQKDSIGAKVDDQKIKAGVESGAGIGVNTKKEYRLEKNVDFEYHGEPVVPELVLYKNNSDINQLIKMRMEGGIRAKTYSLKYATTFGINLTMAKKIDAAIDAYKYETNASVAAEVEKENRVILEYHIEF